MTAYNTGDIVAVEFPFSDLRTLKRRPGLVLVGGDGDLLVARVTTHPPRDASDVALVHWAAAGLPRARLFGSLSSLRLTSDWFTTRSATSILETPG